MILPNKYVGLSESYIGLSAILLDLLKKKKLSIDALWQKLNKKYIESRKLRNPPTFEKFMLTIDFMHAIGFVSYTDEGEIFNENT